MTTAQTFSSASLVRGRYIICKVTGRNQVELLENAALYQESGRIVALGSWEQLRARYPEVPVVGDGSHVVIPGLVNGHHHVGMTPFQLGSPDLPLELWLAHRIRARTVDIELDTLYSAFELVASGVTTVQHLHGRVLPPISQIGEYADKVIGAYAKLGMRVSYSYGIRDQNRLVYEADEQFAQRLPAGLADSFRQWSHAQQMPLEDNFRLFETLLQRYKQHPLARIQLAPVNLHWCSDQALERVAACSETHQAGMHMHLLETRYQWEYARRRTGGSAVKYLDKFGLLNPRMTLGHGVWLEEDELDLLAERGVGICTNASSNLRLRSGIAPWRQFHKRGISVALGIDEAGINEDRDMLQEMRLVKHLHRVAGMDNNDVPSAEDVLQMATQGGANSTPFASEIGVLAVGKAADVVLINDAMLRYPYLDPVTSVVDAVIHRAQREAVDTVVVNGQVIYAGKRFVNVDQQAVLQTLAEQLKQPLTQAEQERHALSEALLPHVQTFYAHYCADCGKKHWPYRAID